MTETAPTYIPCASGTQLMTDCLVQRYGSLVEIIGHPSMHYTPTDARRLALTLLEVADTIEGQETAQTRLAAVNDLRDAAENLADGATWFPPDSIGTSELLVATEDMNYLREALKTLESLDDA